MLDHLDPFVRRSVALALYRMMTGPKFDLCVVTDGLRAAGLGYDERPMSALRLHHCERYAEMPEGFHAELASATLALFAGRPVLGDSFLRDLAVAAGLHAEDAPTVQQLVPAPAAA